MLILLQFTFFWFWSEFIYLIMFKGHFYIFMWEFICSFIFTIFLSGFWSLDTYFILYSRNIINLLSMLCAINIFFQSFDCVSCQAHYFLCSQLYQCLFSLDISPMFLFSICMVTFLILRPWTHLRFILSYGIKYGSNFGFFPMALLKSSLCSVIWDSHHLPPLNKTWRSIWAESTAYTKTNQATEHPSVQGCELKYVCENNAQRSRRGNKGWRGHTVREQAKKANEEAGWCWDRTKQRY